MVQFLSFFSRHNFWNRSDPFNTIYMMQLFIVVVTHSFIGAIWNPFHLTIPYPHSYQFPIMVTTSNNTIIANTNIPKCHQLKKCHRLDICGCKWCSKYSSTPLSTSNIHLIAYWDICSELIYSASSEIHHKYFVKSTPSNSPNLFVNDVARYLGDLGVPHPLFKFNYIVNSCRSCNPLVKDTGYNSQLQSEFIYCAGCWEVNKSTKLVVTSLQQPWQLSHETPNVWLQMLLWWSCDHPNYNKIPF